jgi:glycosyltransferase involved in cell wall biosynthesis
VTERSALMAPVIRAERWPAVTAVIATRDRPVLLQRAVDGVISQDYPGSVECVVVFDQSFPREITIEPETPDRQVRIVTNNRTPGLAGARNSGIRTASGELVAFCDDDDEWLPVKLRRQVEIRQRYPDASAVSTGIRIITEDGDYLRVPPERTAFRDFLTSRVSAIHPSTLLFAKSDLIGPVGLVDENLPSSYGEDYELLLRASRAGPVVGVREPLVNVYWNRPSFFTGRWEGIAGGLTYVLDVVPEFAEVPRGRARIEGQIAFAHAAAGHRQLSMRWAGRALSHDPRQLRAWAALAVSARLVNAERLVRVVQGRGKGL